jgi:hypothetical protein
MKKATIATKGEMIVIILVPQDFSANIDEPMRKLSQVLAGIYKSAQETGDKNLLREAVRVLNQGIADSAKKILQMLPNANKNH